MNKFEELEAFVAVVDWNSFSLAAEKSGLAKSAVSRRVSDLEKRLGVQLLQRTTRKLSLTDSGRHFYQRAVNLLADLNEAEQVITEAQCSLSGKIKLTAPLGIGVSRLARPIAEFMKRHVDIEIDMDLNDRQVDLVADSFDLAVRIGSLRDSNLVVRKLTNIGFAVCASQDYLDKHGEPKHPSELADHQVMVYSNVPTGRQWCFYEGDNPITPRVRYRLSANNGALLARAACQGLGITAGPLFYLEESIERGDLVPILRDFSLPDVGMYVVYPPGRLVSRRVKMLSDYFFNYFHETGI